MLQTSANSAHNAVDPARKLTSEELIQILGGPERHHEVKTLLWEGRRDMGQKLTSALTFDP